ncbi:hypothetical protein B0T18DRAFT_427906 [Schizothecium vesticola]|uniref:HNH domain-containing protein n=1 Tax=Schizothecium vesticola TaxID=314040 RepID=A0AA40K8F1_9PEZI|nr:hypothetical protein B0T18DRAFT_427906 [Schizothecium vesticola]
MSIFTPEAESANYEVFRDSLSAVLIQRLTQTPAKPARRSKHQQNKAPEPLSEDAEDLSDFIDYIGSEVFTTLPAPLRTLDWHTWSTSPSLQSAYSLPLTAQDVSPLVTTLDPSISDSLFAYGITTSTETAPLPSTSSALVLTLPDLLAPILTAYLTTLTAPPPPPSSTKAQAQASGCEICGRDWINLSYHHLIPRFVHAKAVKRGWHRPDELQNVAWLCGACHARVHAFAGHEELARRYYTVELLMAEPEMVAWAGWVGKLRWKGTGKRREGV